MIKFIQKKNEREKSPMNKKRNLTVTATCIHCGTIHKLRVNKEDWFKYKTGAGIVQNTLPYLTRAERDFLILKTCGDCWKKLWQKE